MSNTQILQNQCLQFDVSVYGAIEKVSDTLSKSRVRIFYKGMNRNRTYISEDFANQLIASLPYSPVKGIFDKDSLDYEDHGEDNTDGRIYGIVPETTNFAWEDFEDEDGVIRTYACADVLLFTGLYPEASLIPGKSQSMEIYRKTLVGEWRLSDIDGQPYYHFLSGSLVGLQVLGDDTEPCFQGSAFFELKNDIDKIINYIKQSSKQEEMVMEKSLFRLSDCEKANLIETLVNPNFNEEGGWRQDRVILDVYDDYAVCYNMPNHNYERVYYSKNDSEVTIGDIVSVQIVDVTETEYTALEAMKSIGSYETIQSSYAQLESENSELKGQVEQFETNVAELNEKITTQTAEIAAKEEEIASYSASVEELNSKISTNETEQAEKFAQWESEKAELVSAKNDLINENEKLSEFKCSVESAQKQEILDKFSEHLSEEVISNLTELSKNMSVVDFKKEVQSAAVDCNGASVFSKTTNGPNFFYKNGSDRKSTRSSACDILEKYINGGNK